MNTNIYKKYIAVFLICFITMVHLPQQIQAEEKLTINADAAILVEVDSGKILFKHNANKALGIASMTKMMTEYLVLEAVETGKVKWDQTYTVSDKVYALANAPGLSNVPLHADEQYTVKELYEAMVIKSANGASIALAEVVAGSEGEFVKMMNQKAKELELEHYQFVNSTGLSNYDMLGMHPEGTDVNAENLMSAKDTAALAYHLINDFPEVLETASLSTKDFRKGTNEELIMKNTNAMLPGRTFEYKGADGLKTGTTPFAGSTFTGTAKRNGVRYISVIMDSKDALDNPSSAERFIQTAELFDYGFHNFSNVEFTFDDVEKKAKHTIPVADGKEEKVEIKTKEHLSLRIKTENKSNAKLELTIDESKLNEDGELQAPIEEGEKIGELTVEDPKKYDYIIKPTDTEQKIDVYAAASVEKENWFVRSAKAIGDFFGSIF
ncbi:D-alanyl-D-alanine carboxypeptidase (penicillin-binding protein 5/6) [Bacillus pakistanensis]|uniref:serine-type D-Ala-D-Ala carboxypeptidase n=2 Tax=Rossellomorea pakistanensis TaxID=992288 RepID=A0ABS2N9C4_9BACI|nr:serine hydrolase [Bacillus pakistanensis]MBM7584461.1 D-alanyl-D-alanine carboxypeptidase (penicillin-binding protein 5/6) [Bacillus pakistanensis]